MIRRPPRSTLSSSSAASDVYKRQRFMTARLAIALSPDIQFQFPALRAVAGNAPHLECPDLRHPRFQADRQNGSLLTVDVQSYFERAQFFDIVCPVLR